MPEFLVAIEVALPPSTDAAVRDELTAAERARGRELVESGAIQRIWRIPGATRNVGVWRAGDATELHGLIRSLPLAPWCRVDVTALAVHPLEGGPDA